MAIAIAGGEIHGTVDPGWIVAQVLLDHASGPLDEVAPVDRADSVRRLPMLLLIATWFAACCCKPSIWIRCSIFWPDSDRRCSIQLSGSASAGLWPCSRRVISATNEPFSSAGRSAPCRPPPAPRCSVSPLGGGDHAVGPAHGLAAIAPGVGHDPGRDAAQVLDQRQPQHDRDRPQLAHVSQWGNRLVGIDEALQTGLVSTRPSPCEMISSAMSFADPGQTGRRAAVQPRQLAAVSPWANAGARCGSVPRPGKSCPTTTHRPA